MLLTLCGPGRGALRFALPACVHHVHVSHGMVACTWFATWFATRAIIKTLVSIGCYDWVTLAKGRVCTGKVLMVASMRVVVVVCS